MASEILVVEDDERIRKALRLALEEEHRRAPLTLPASVMELQCRRHGVVSGVGHHVPVLDRR